jgi:uncharacterized membrane protein
MGVLIIGIAVISLLLWVLMSSLATEIQAEKRRTTQVAERSGYTQPPTVPDAETQAA